jgi:hypothetical protein
MTINRDMEKLTAYLETLRITATVRIQSTVLLTESIAVKLLNFGPFSVLSRASVS